MKADEDDVALQFFTRLSEFVKNTSKREGDPKRIEAKKLKKGKKGKKEKKEKSEGETSEAAVC